MLDSLKSIFKARFVPIYTIYTVLFSVLIIRLFSVQIINNENLTTDDNSKKKEIELKSTRGKIYDRNGVLIAYNKLSYTVILEDIGALETNAEKNAMIHKLITIIEKQGGKINDDFFIKLNDKGELEFAEGGRKEENFKRDAYSVRSVEDLTTEQLEATPMDVFEWLKRGKGSNSTSMFGISDEYKLEEALKIMQIRYNLMMNKFEKYMPITVASDVNSKTVAAINEYSSELPGVDVLNETYREYNDSEAYAHILGYTGLITSEELEEVTKDGTITYSATDQIGKTGLEEYLEKYLHGEKGSEIVQINASSEVEKVLEVNEPTAGNDVYLTLDSNLQKASYTLLEKEITGILLSKLVNKKSVGTFEDASDIEIPVYDIYYAFITNGVIDTDHFTKVDAKPYEKSTYKKYTVYREAVKKVLKSKLAYNLNNTKKDFGEIQYEYIERIYDILLSNKVIIEEKIPTTDEMLNNFEEGTISFTSFMKHVISNGWIDLSLLDVEDNSFLSSGEIYNKILEYAISVSFEDEGMNKIVYKDMIYNGTLPTSHVCILLMEQNIIKYNKNMVTSLATGQVSAYEYVKARLKDLDINPGQLGLDPCSGSVVITDVDSSDVLAMVSYPSYDNNKLANTIDSDYYGYLLGNSASPLVNRATLTCTAPGSTFKMVTSAAALETGTIGTGTHIRDNVVFTKTGHPAKCYYRQGHGSINVVDAIGVSCNYFFYDVGYRMSLQNGSYKSDKGLETIRKYATMFGFDEKSGVEVAEYKPSISTEDSIRTAIGQGNNAFAPVQIAKYVNTLANTGTCFNLSLIDKIQDVNGKVVLDNKSKVSKKVKLADSTWNAIHKGMHTVVNGPKSSVKSLYKDLGVTVAGKTGTAQQDTSRPSHALFVSYAPYENPEIAITVVIPFGYGSYNAADLAQQIYQYYFELTDTDALMDSEVDDTEVDSSNQD